MRLKLKQYIELMDLLKGKDVEDKTSTEFYTEYPETVRSIIACCSDAKEGLTASQEVGLLELIMNSIAFPEPTDFPPFFYINETYYHPPDNFTYVESDASVKDVIFGMLSFGDTLEAFRLDELMKGNYKMLPYVLAHIYKEDNPVHYTKRAEVFMELDMADAYGAYFFLSSIEGGLRRSISNQAQATTEHPNTRKLLNWLKKMKLTASDGITRLGQRLEVRSKTNALKARLHMKSLSYYFTKR
jgi:hypothetical protein